MGFEKLCCAFRTAFFFLHPFIAWGEGAEVAEHIGDSAGDE